MCTFREEKCKIQQIEIKKIVNKTETTCKSLLLLRRLKG